MKIALLCISIVSLSFTACAVPPAARMTVKVLDGETSAPMSNCVVKTRFLVKSHWNDPDEYDEQACISDADGICVFNGIDDSFGYGGGVLSSNYYPSSFKVPYTGINRVLNRWEPWNPTIEVKMRPKKSPVPMVHKKVEWKFKIPKYNTPIGLDLGRGDWVQPYGSGVVSDMTMEIIPLYPEEKGSQCRISFPNPEDGIQEYTFEWPTSDFKWPYSAPTNGYEQILDKYYVLNLPRVEGAPEHNLDKNANYLVRTRTQVDEDGQVISACYGYFQGEIMFLPRGEFQFEYYFNPVPNERSLEWNGVNLLPPAKKKR